MQTVLSKPLNFLKYIRGFFPMALPTGMTEMESFLSFILTTYSFPDLESYRNAIATMIHHLGPLTISKTPYFFYKSLKKSMANQAAFEVIERIRDEQRKRAAEKQKQELELAEAAKQNAFDAVKHDGSPESFAGSTETSAAAI